MWESYMGIAKSNDLNVAKYNLFKDGKFDIENFKDSVLKIGYLYNLFLNIFKCFIQ